MSRQLSITIPDNPADSNHDGKVSFDELLRSTVWIVVLLIAGTNVVGLSVAMLVSGRNVLAVLSWWLSWWLWLSLGLSVCIGVAIGVRRQLKYERDLREWYRERERRWDFEDEDRAMRSGLQNETTRIDQADLDLAAWEILRAYYAGRDWSRGKVSGVSDVRWNKVNDLFQKRHIRDGRKPRLNPDTLDAAWTLWLQGKKTARSFRMSGDSLEEAE